MKVTSYAVNLADWLGKKDDYGLAILLKPVIESKTVIECEPRRFDGMGIVLDCADGRATAIIEIIRKRYKKYQLRCYKGSGRTWKRI